MFPRARKCCSCECRSPTNSRPASPIRFESSGRSYKKAMLAASWFASFTRYRSPVSPSSTNSRLDPRSEATTVRHGFKQVSFGPSEPEVVLVAVQNSHECSFQLLPVWVHLHRLRVPENLGQSLRGSAWC